MNHDRIRAADGKLVSVDGFMIPLEYSGKKVSKFILAINQNTCCFGGNPQIHEFIIVSVAGGGLNDEMDIPLRVKGVLRVRVIRSQGKLSGHYQLESQIVASAEGMAFQCIYCVGLSRLLQPANIIPLIAHMPQYGHAMNVHRPAPALEPFRRHVPASSILERKQSGEIVNYSHDYKTATLQPVIVTVRLLQEYFQNGLLSQSGWPVLGFSCQFAAAPFGAPPVEARDLILVSSPHARHTEHILSFQLRSLNAAKPQTCVTGAARHKGSMDSADNRY